MAKVIAVQPEQMKKLSDNYNALKVKENNASIISGVLDNNQPTAESSQISEPTLTSTPTVDMEGDPVNMGNAPVVSPAITNEVFNSGVETPNAEGPTVENPTAPEVAAVNSPEMVVPNSGPEVANPLGSEVVFPEVPVANESANEHSAADLINPEPAPEVNPFAVNPGALNMFDNPTVNETVENNSVSNNIFDSASADNSAEQAPVAMDSSSADLGSSNEFDQMINALRNKIDNFTSEIHAELDRIQEAVKMSSATSSMNNDDLDKTVVIPGDVMAAAQNELGRSL